jgi:hypothetical protein
MNHELSELIENADIVRFKIIIRIAWLGNVMPIVGKRVFRMETNRQEN